MFTIDRWRKWRPEQIIEKTSGTGLTKPTKPPFVSSVGPKSEVFPITEAAASASLEKLRRPFVAWFDSRVWLDAESVALRRPLPRWSSGVHVLHADLCAWMFAHHRKLLPTREQFRQLLDELCCEVRLIHGEEYVSHVALKEDEEAQWVFDSPEPQLPEPPEAPAPAIPFEFDFEHPTMPDGVRLISFEPLPGPVRLFPDSTVTDVPTFIATTLRQLDHALHGRPWMAGNWPPSTLIHRLAACGCAVELKTEQ